VQFRAGIKSNFIDSSMVGPVRYRSRNRGLTPTADAVAPAGLAFNNVEALLTQDISRADEMFCET
jgi:hypothetical protein